jgi:hypothetical protein
MNYRCQRRIRLVPCGSSLPDAAAVRRPKNQGRLSEAASVARPLNAKGKDRDLTVEKAIAVNNVTHDGVMQSSGVFR